MIIKGIIIAGICSFAACLIQVLLCLLGPGRGKAEPMILELRRQAKSAILIWLFMALPYAGVFLRADPAALSGTGLVALSFCYGIIFYFFLTCVYLTLYYFVDRSISATLLEIIGDSGEKGLSLDEIKEIYGIEKKYKKELRGMLQGRFIVEERGTFRNTFKGSFCAAGTDFIKRLLKLGKGG